MPPDYSGQNLRGRSFKGQNLTGANFCNADIRGTNFTNAILQGTNFSYVQAGLTYHWAVLLIIASLCLSIVSGTASGITGILTSENLFLSRSQNLNAVRGVTVCIVLAVFWITTFYKGLAVDIWFVLAVADAGMIVVLGGVLILLFQGKGVNVVTGVAWAVVGVAMWSLVSTFAGSLVVFSCALEPRILAVLKIAAWTFGLSVAVLAYPDVFVKTPSGWAVIVTATIVIIVTYLSSYAGWQALIGNEKFTLIRNIAIAFSATGGTNFYGADLTDADFTGATLKNTDLRKANLTRARFYEAKKLDFARVEDTILTNPAILNLLVTCNGKGKSYISANLKGANLIGADLKDANLQDADISEATFQGGCLEWANLTLTQAVGTDFTSAQMTGACVEAWNIENTTKLDNVDCRFVYLLENAKPGSDDRERRPSSGEFQPGEFTKLFEEVLNTVDLIFRDGIDWKAFVTAFKKVQVQNEDTQLAIQSIENKSDGVVVVKVAVPVDADKEKIHSDFTQNYQLALQAVEEKYKAQLQAKDEQIVIYRQQSGEMTEIVKLLANKPINFQVDNKVENKNMTNSNDSSRNINVGRDFNATGTINLGEINDAVINTINQLPTSSEPEKPGIKELLTQLQAAIEADKNLADEDKAEALEQVKALAEAGKNPQEGGMQKAAKTAIKILKGTIASLPSATKLVEQCSNLLPLISTFLGLG
jgi:uncharacterized protein YjbI with pentapeptide repeats